jgi:hypothetical protein
MISERMKNTIIVKLRIAPKNNRYSSFPHHFSRETPRPPRLAYGAVLRHGSPGAIFPNHFNAASKNHISSCVSQGQLISEVLSVMEHLWRDNGRDL